MKTNNNSHVGEGGGSYRRVWQGQQRRTDRATVGESACDCHEITMSSERSWRGKTDWWVHERGGGEGEGGKRDSSRRDSGKEVTETMEWDTSEWCGCTGRYGLNDIDLDIGIE